MVRPTYAEIDLSAIAANTRAFAELIAPSELCAVVKADAYGHGDVPVATTALDAGATWLAVALVEEAVRLREAEIDAPILLLSEPLPEDVAEIVEWDLTPTAYSQRFIEALASAGSKLAVHLKVDTGMHRVGAAPRALADLVTAMRRAGNLDLEGVWTHFPVADEDPEFTSHQIEEFDKAVSGLEVPLAHLANTAGAVLFPEARRSLCRIGLGLYGLHPCDETRERISLRPAMRLVTQVTSVRRLEAGARPSYGRMRPLPGESTVVTAPVGYADGYSRGLSLGGQVLIGGRRHPLAGTVTMDQIMVDVGDEDVEIGDEVVLMGAQGSEEITAYEWARLMGTITYEVICSVGPRVPRQYVT
jgi:alanine racemase